MPVGERFTLTTLLFTPPTTNLGGSSRVPTQKIEDPPEEELSPLQPEHASKKPDAPQGHTRQ